MPRAGCGQLHMTGILKTTRQPPGLPDTALRKGKLVPTSLTNPFQLCICANGYFSSPRQGRLGQARPPAALPAYLRLRAAGERRHRSAPRAEAHGAGRASGSGSGRSRAPREAIALPAVEAREPTPLRGPLSGRPPCATAAATNAARGPSPDP